MDRPADAPLGPAPEIGFAQAMSGKDDDALAASERALDERRPELMAAARAVTRTEAALDASKREATLPTIMVGADYWYMPTLEMRHGYGAMLTVSLPWLNPRHRDEVKSAEQLLAAERSALGAQRASARYQLHDAAAKVRAARAALSILHARVLPDARRAYESAEAQLQAGHGDVGALVEAARALPGCAHRRGARDSGAGGEPRRLRARRRRVPMTDAREEGAAPPEDRRRRQACARGGGALDAGRSDGDRCVGVRRVQVRLASRGRVVGDRRRSAEQILYQCPMHPAIVQDHPGECPICGMTLVRRTAAEIGACAERRRRCRGARTACLACRPSI